MTRVMGLAIMILLALSAQAAATCFGSGYTGGSNHAVETTLHVDGGSGCLVPFYSGGPLSGYAMLQRPSHGTATIGPLKVFYQPRHGFVGDDSFTFSRSGRTLLGAPVTYTVHVAVIVAP